MNAWFGTLKEKSYAWTFPFFVISLFVPRAVFYPNSRATLFTRARIRASLKKKVSSTFLREAFAPPKPTVSVDATRPPSPPLLHGFSYRLNL